ncbi:uncharacterized protein LOC122370950 [Amphibalanus amphitrite]|uniref:uncharacterized protein LOC122370950 n=1 Tax=Amphibalanus amphitrite TaxID=1232801 RepID=UPI001C90FD18|nr:uncharacterized protein LOC122370950 [Amphibalanus amphitrite]
MAARVVLVLALVAVAAASPDVARCYDCFTSTASSACHVRPQNEPNGKAVCPRGTKRCVTERHQTSDGNLISLRRRCATVLESRFSYNRCDAQPDGTSRCLSYCRDPSCNRGTGRLYPSTRFWNHDGPDYADYVFDPEQAVLDPAYGGEARHSKHIQDDQMLGLGGGAGGVAVSLGVMMASLVARMVVV